MAGTYKITELVGTSPVSFAEAAKAAVAEAAKTIRHMESFQISGRERQNQRRQGRGVPSQAENRV